MIDGRVCKREGERRKRGDEGAQGGKWGFDNNRILMYGRSDVRAFAVAALVPQSLAVHALN
jgi:hypothetical protein